MRSEIIMYGGGSNKFDAYSSNLVRLYWADFIDGEMEQRQAARDEAAAKQDALGALENAAAQLQNGRGQR